MPDGDAKTKKQDKIDGNEVENRLLRLSDYEYLLSEALKSLNEKIDKDEATDAEIQDAKDLETALHYLEKASSKIENITGGNSTIINSIKNAETLAAGDQSMTAVQQASSKDIDDFKKLTVFDALDRTYTDKYLSDPHGSQIMEAVKFTSLNIIRSMKARSITQSDARYMMPNVLVKCCVLENFDTIKQLSSDDIDKMRDYMIDLVKAALQYIKSESLSDAKIDELSQKELSCLKDGKIIFYASRSNLDDQGTIKTLNRWFDRHFKGIKEEKEREESGPVRNTLIPEWLHVTTDRANLMFNAEPNSSGGYDIGKWERGTDENGKPIKTKISTDLINLSLVDSDLPASVDLRDKTILDTIDTIYCRNKDKNIISSGDSIILTDYEIAQLYGGYGKERPSDSLVKDIHDRIDKLMRTFISLDFTEAFENLYSDKLKAAILADDEMKSLTIKGTFLQAYRITITTTQGAERSAIKLLDEPIYQRWAKMQKHYLSYPPKLRQTQFRRTERYYQLLDALIYQVGLRKADYVHTMRIAIDKDFYKQYGIKTPEELAGDPKRFKSDHSYQTKVRQYYRKDHMMIEDALERMCRTEEYINNDDGEPVTYIDAYQAYYSKERRNKNLPKGYEITLNKRDKEKIKAKDDQKKKIIKAKKARQAAYKDLR